MKSDHFQYHLVLRLDVLCQAGDCAKMSTLNSVKKVTEVPVLNWAIKGLEAISLHLDSSKTTLKRSPEETAYSFEVTLSNLK